MAANLDALGWHQVDPATTTPDVNVLVSVTATRYLEYVSYPFYSWYPGWAGFTGYDATWGVYYPWVYGGAYATVIDAGSLRIEMLDVRTPDPTTKQLTAIWTASLDGVLGGSSPVDPRPHQPRHRPGVRPVPVPVSHAMRSTRFLVVATLLSSSAALAQSHVRISYEMAQPEGNTARYIDRFSSRGAHLDVSLELSYAFHFELSAGLNSFNAAK